MINCNPRRRLLPAVLFLTVLSLALAACGLIAPGAEPPPAEPTSPAAPQPTPTSSDAGAGAASNTAGASVTNTPVPPAPTATAASVGDTAAAPAPTDTPEVVVADGRSIKQWPAPPPMTIDPGAAYTAVLQTTAGDITVELLPGDAPATVNNFVFLAREGFYDGVIFHRTIPGFMIQGGDPTGTGGGGPGYRFADEPVRRPYDRGTLAMANAGPNTNGSQFFLMHADYPLPPSYTIFGQTVAGLDVIDAIATAPTSANTEPIKIYSVSFIAAYSRSLTQPQPAISRYIGKIANS